MEKAVLWKLSYGLYAVGAMDRERPCGCIINTATQVASEPSLLTISMNKNNYTHELIERGREFSLSVLSVDSDPLVITYLGFRSGRDVDKFEDVEYASFHGLPVITSNPCGVMKCSVKEKMDVGSHTVFLAQVVEGESRSDVPPMTYAYYHSVVKGKAPKNAPTYRAEV